MVRFHLALFDATGEPHHLDSVVAGADWLCRSASRTGGSCTWFIPEPWGGYTALGYAHGAAGIADVLLDVWETTGHARYWQTAKVVASWLSSIAERNLYGGNGVNWSAFPDRRNVDVVGWCHGAAGIGRFLLHASAAGAHLGGRDMAIEAGWTVARGRRGDPAIQCHGLAGHVEYLLDLAQATDDLAWVREAESMLDVLLGCVVPRAGVAVTPSSIPTEVRPGLMTGYVGVGHAAARLIDRQLPGVLSKPVRFSHADSAPMHRA
jgi:lantibiotic modifying enzyme